METLKQCSERVLQLQLRIAELEGENERLQAENIQLQSENQTLRTSEARYQKCFENSPISDAQQALLQEQAAIAREREAAALEQAVKLENVNAIMRDSVRQLSNEADIETFLGYVLTKIAQQIEANYICLFRYDDSNHTLTLHLSYLDGKLRKGTSGDELELWAAPFPADITPAFELMCQHKQFFTPTMSPIPPEEFAWPGTMEWLSHVQATEAAHLVLFVGNNPVGSMGLAFTNEKTLQLSTGRSPAP